MPVVLLLFPFPAPISSVEPPVSSVEPPVSSVEVGLRWVLVDLPGIV